MSQPRELAPENLCRVCDVGLFEFESTADLPPLEQIISQARATRAIDIGIEIPSRGFNIFALGPPGVGKSTTISRFLERKAATRPVPDDWAYVNNFSDPHRPRALPMPAGRGCDFRDDMDKLIEQLEPEITRAFESDYYEEKKKEPVEQFQAQQAEQLKELEQYLNERGFALLRTPRGLAIAPVMEGKVLSPEEYEALPAEVKTRFESQRPALQEQMDKTMKQSREQEKRIRERMERLDRELAAFVVGDLIEELKTKYADCKQVVDFLDVVLNDVVQNVGDFRRPVPEQQPAMPFMMRGAPAEARAQRYRVNLIVDNCEAKGAPVITEPNPTYQNLIGRIEHRVELGALMTDFTMIKAGALHMANGGYLVVEASELFKNPLTWDALKRAIRDERIKIEAMGEAYRPIATTTLDPEPFPLNVKVVVVGDARTYYLLYNLDPEFRELFKVKADFETRMDWNDENIGSYASVIADRCRAEDLTHFDRSGVARMVEYGSRLAGDQHKLTTRFSDILDVVREASFWASRNGHELTTGEDVLQAVRERVHRSNRIEESGREMIDDGTIFVATDGEVVGQVNGLSVIGLGDYTFGKPSRITARTFMGRSGVVNIDREVKMTGPIHDKGLLILSGYLGAKYAQDKPLSLSASITFEQAYEGIEGDSASSTELYALLSSLSSLPIKQGIAVTGSVNQFGEVQPIGGAIHKIEGFFDVCEMRGLTGEQGVIIPESNSRHLSLREDVVQAVRDGRFHIYPVKTIDEGISVLTGREAGAKDEAEQYPEGSVNFLVNQRLDELSEEWKKRGGEADEEEAEGPTEGEEDEEEPSEPPEDGPSAAAHRRER